MADLPGQFAALEHELMPAVREVAASGGYVLGPHVARFEEAFARFCGAPHCVAVNSGTSALHLAMICAGVGAGDEVIVPAMTFVATAWAVSYCGATPVFADIDPFTCTLCPRAVEKRITRRTKLIVPVHLYGQPADMMPLMEVAARHGIAVIEDAAQAHGAAYGGIGAGTMGLCGCFSFYPGKNLGAFGEGGAIVTRDDAIAARLRALRDHGQSARYHHEELGFNYRMDALQGAVLGIKLRHLERWTEARRRLAARYGRILAGLPIMLPVSADNRRHVWHLYVVRHPRRDAIKQAMERRGVQVGMHYPIPVHLQGAYRHLGGRRGDCPIAEQLGEACLTLPLFPEMTESQQDRVAEALAEALVEIDASADAAAVTTSFGGPGSS